MPAATCRPARRSGAAGWSRRRTRSSGRPRRCRGRSSRAAPGPAPPRCPSNQACGAGTGGGAEVPGEAARRHRRAGGQPVDRQRPVQVRLRPGQHVAQPGVLVDAGHRGLDVLRLAAVAVRRDDHPSCHGVGDRRAVLVPDRVQAGVDAGRRAGAGGDRAVVDVEDVEDVGVDGDGRVAPSQVRGEHPVRRDRAPVEHAGGREDRGTAAVAHHAGAAGHLVPAHLAELLRRCGVGVLPAHRDHQVRGAGPLEAVLQQHREPGVGADGSGLGGHQREVVAGQTVSRPVAADDLGDHAGPEAAEPVPRHRHQVPERVTSDAQDWQEVGGQRHSCRCRHDRRERTVDVRPVSGPVTRRTRCSQCDARR